MEIEFRDCYYVYVLTDVRREMLQVGVTIDLQALLNPGFILAGAAPEPRYLLYYETFEDAAAAIMREGKLSGFSKRKLRRLVAVNNPGWTFLETFNN